MPARSSSFAVAFVVLSSLSLGSLAACGDDGGGTAIDAPATVDAPTGGDGGGPDAPAAAPTCSDYCTASAASCTAANLMYASTGECMATCMRFTAGTVGQTSGNTLGCRLYHAGAAAGSVANANTHCRHGGPGGDTLCGTNCEGFCTIVLGSCTAGNLQYGGSMSTCMTACAGYATTPIYVANATGNNFACRLYHATAAAALPGTHCPHTGVTSAACP